jgi:hypothetical protein
MLTVHSFVLICGGIMQGLMMHFANLRQKRLTAAVLKVTAVFLAVPLIGPSMAAEPAAGAAAAPQPPKPELTEVATPPAPRAAQIEAMVAPVKRVAPQTPESKNKAASSPAPNPQKNGAKARGSNQKSKSANKITAKTNARKKR